MSLLTKFLVLLCSVEHVLSTDSPSPSFTPSSSPLTDTPSSSPSSAPSSSAPSSSPTTSSPTWSPTAFPHSTPADTQVISAQYTRVETNDTFGVAGGLFGFYITGYDEHERMMRSGGAIFDVNVTGFHVTDFDDGRYHVAFSLYKAGQGIVIVTLNTTILDGGIVPYTVVAGPTSINKTAIIGLDSARWNSMSSFFIEPRDDWGNPTQDQSLSITIDMQYNDSPLTFNTTTFPNGTYRIDFITTSSMLPPTRIHTNIVVNGTTIDQSPFTTVIQKPVVINYHFSDGQWTGLIILIIIGVILCFGAVMCFKSFRTKQRAKVAERAGIRPERNTYESVIEDKKDDDILDDDEDDAHLARTPWQPRSNRY